jgi:hypothetical protein
MNVEWVGGPNDGAKFAVEGKPKAVVYETLPTPDGSTHRYTIPIREHRIWWAERIEDTPTA